VCVCVCVCVICVYITGCHDVIITDLTLCNPDNAVGPLCLSVCNFRTK